jgi:hypothetical protein
MNKKAQKLAIFLLIWKPAENVPKKLAGRDALPRVPKFRHTRTAWDEKNARSAIEAQVPTL